MTIDEPRAYAEVEFTWDKIPRAFDPPTHGAVRIDGYRESEGFADIFMIDLVLTEGRPATGSVQRAQVFSRLGSMSGRLPLPGERFALCDGWKPPFAVATTLARG
ncbi:MAG TPA: hypothetical protein VGB85_07875, partial [Nannocystis sp.]